MIGPICDAVQYSHCAAPLPVSVLSTVTAGTRTAPQSEEATHFAQSWQELRADGDIQFSPVTIEQDAPDPPPDWLMQFFEWLGNLLEPVGRAMVAIWPIGKWVLLAMVAALVLLAMVRAARGRDWRLRQPAGPPGADWVPENQAATALLEEADRLANEGRYDEATHLLLIRSVGQIAQARPDLVEPSSTAREIAAEPALPDGARKAFGAIAERVERSLFALRKLSSDDWQVARDAYAEFALAQKNLRA